MNFAAWAGAVCMAAAGCTVLHILVGNKGVGKVFRLLTAAFFLCAVLSPLLSLKDTFKLPQLSAGSINEAVEDTALQQMQRATESILLQKVNEALKNHDLLAKKLEIHMDTSADGRISITDIVLYIPPGNALHRNWVREIAKERLGMEVVVEYAEE